MTTMCIYDDDIEFSLLFEKKEDFEEILKSYAQG